MSVYDDRQAMSGQYLLSREELGKRCMTEKNVFVFGLSMNRVRMFQILTIWAEKVSDWLSLTT